MIYLTTGGNGTGKTLFNLKWVRELQEKTGRPVYHNGRFALTDEKVKEFGWKEFKASEWQSLPDGAIILLDEAHNDLPVRPTGQKPPEWIAAIAEHRRRGFDFFLITQHPTNIDNFVRKLIASPGWHRHLRRVMGLDAVTCVEFTFAHTSPEKPTSKAEGDAKRMSYPKEVYQWYSSAVMHTGKRQIPAKLWFGLFALLVVVVCGLLTLSWVNEKTKPAEQKIQAENQPAVVKTSHSQPRNPPPQLDWFELQKPRVPELPHTAPKYDDVTKPTKAPRPAACVVMGSRCECFTQQATKMPTIRHGTCVAIARGGWFQDWDDEISGQSTTGRAPVPTL